MDELPESRDTWIPLIWVFVSFHLHGLCFGNFAGEYIQRANNLPLTLSYEINKYRFWLYARRTCATETKQSHCFVFVLWKCMFCHVYMSCLMSLHVLRNIRNINLNSNLFQFHYRSYVGNGYYYYRFQFIALFHLETQHCAIDPFFTALSTNNFKIQCEMLETFQVSFCHVG